MSILNGETSSSRRQVPLFFPLYFLLLFFPFSSAHQQSGPATEVDETFKYTEILYCNKNGLSHSCTRLALQTDAAFPFCEEDSSQPGLLSLLFMSESPFRSLCVLICVFMVTIYYVAAATSER